MKRHAKSIEGAGQCQSIGSVHNVYFATLKDAAVVVGFIRGRGAKFGSAAIADWAGGTVREDCLPICSLLAAAFQRKGSIDGPYLCCWLVPVVVVRVEIQDVLSASAKSRLAGEPISAWRRARPTLACLVQTAQTPTLTTMPTTIERSHTTPQL